MNHHLLSGSRYLWSKRKTNPRKESLQKSVIKLRNPRMQGRRRFLLRIQRRLLVRRQLTRIHCGCNCSHFDYKYESKSYMCQKYIIRINILGVSVCPTWCVSLPYMTQKVSVCPHLLSQKKSL